MSTETLLIIIVLVLLLGGGGFYWRRGRWWTTNHGSAISGQRSRASLPFRFWWSPVTK